MKYKDLRDFIDGLEKIGELKRVQVPVSPRLEMTEICDRVLKSQGPALLFEHPQGSSIPVLGNLFGTPQRVALGMGQASVAALREVGQTLAALKEPTPPAGLKDAGRLWSMVRAVWDMHPKKVSAPPCQELVFEGGEVDLAMLPVQTCWPGDAAALITWGLVITRGPQNVAKPRQRQNLGIYRQQVLGRNKVIMRWLAHRGGALDFRDFAAANPGQPFPMAVALGADPATMLGAVTPVPDHLSEYQFAGLLRGERTEVSSCLGSDLEVPARAEIVLEGHIQVDSNNRHGVAGYEHALEGPFGDHTGYYNETEWFPVFTIDRLTMRRAPIYHSTYTGKPPDEPAILGVALNEVFVPLLQRQFAEIVDFYLPPEGCSYRLAIVSIKKAYPGHAKRVMFGVWSFLRQFMYTKIIIVVDDDIDVRNWKEVVWAITTRVDALRDTSMIDQTPIDYLDFASPQSGLGSKMGIDATNKWPGETVRPWGQPIVADPATVTRIDALWPSLGPVREVCRALAADLAAALLLTMLALGPAQAESEAPIELGLIEAMSGAFSNAGSVAKANIQIAIDRINQAGGIHLADGNHRVALTTFDSQNSTEQALLGLTQLSDRGVRIFLQGNSSAVALTLVDAIERHNQRMPDQALLFLNYSAVDPALTNAHCSFWHFRFDANSNMRMNALTDVLHQDPQVHRVFLIGQDYVFGRQVAAVARQMIQAKRPDVEIVGDLLHPIGQVRDFAPYIARIQASRADAVVTGNWGSDLSLLVKAARQAGLTARFYTFYGDSLGAPEEIGTAGINQVLAVSEWNPNSTPAALAYARAYRAHFRDAAASYQFLRIDVMLQMLAQALQQAGRIDARAVAQALETGHFVNGFFEARMRATDHQIDEPLVVSRLVAIDPNDAQHIDQEGSGLGFLPVRYFSAAQTRLRSTCVMRR